MIAAYLSRDGWITLRLLDNGPTNRSCCSRSLAVARAIPLPSPPA